MIFIVYKTTNLINYKTYIGVHKINESDKYLGSGTVLKLVIKKYASDLFKRNSIRGLE